MLYHLFNWLHAQGIDFAGAGLMKYISFRVVCCALVSIITALWAGKNIIKKLRKNQIGEEIRDLGLEGQLSKKGTPTMGGMIIALAVLVPILLFGDLTNLNNILLIIATVWLGFVGYLDDHAKIVKHNKDGLSGKKKILAQVVLGLVVGITLLFSSQLGFRVRSNNNPEATAEHHVASVVVENNAKTTIPFVKNNEFDYSWLSPFKGEAGKWWTWALYILVIIFIITACSNGANLTDGMDGLSAGVAAIVGTTLGILAYLSGHVGYANYLNIMYIPASGEIAVYMAALVGALLGFLWYNSFPAKVFMGDTGSLMLGGVIGVCAVLIRKELLLPILCGVYLAESLSVIIQRGYFKYTKKKTGTGVRVFRMAPLHHHFQKEEPDALIQKPDEIQPEARIVSRFWIVSIILAVLTIVTLKIR
ncbi:MAG: phospho-N-acetylmuramoyl-pentapeptide-transferase [Bacteroidales bacterium]|nr:phospho-N-acetylmuramoyl-pentapeptide-transferase [Bacteroidales bacterium]